MQPPIIMQRRWFLLLTVLLSTASLVTCRFDQQNPPVQRKINDFANQYQLSAEHSVEISKMAASVPFALFAEADPCSLARLGDRMVDYAYSNLKPPPPLSEQVQNHFIQLAMELMHSEKNFNPSTGPRRVALCNDPTLPKSQPLRGILPLLDPASGGGAGGRGGCGKTASETNQYTSGLLQSAWYGEDLFYLARGKSIQQQVQDVGFVDFAGYTSLPALPPAVTTMPGTGTGSGSETGPATSSTPAFALPGVRFSADHIELLQRADRYQDPVVAQARQSLLEQCAVDMSTGPRAVPEILVAYNPAPHDLERMSVAQRNQMKELQRSVVADQQTKSGAGGGQQVVGGHENWTVDGERAYRLAIAYVITQDPQYAGKSVEIMNAWAVTCKKFGPVNQNGPLESGWGITSMLRSIQILRTMRFAGVTDSFLQNFNQFLDIVIMPNLKHFDFADDQGTPKLATMGNWGTTILEALMMVSVHRNDAAGFNDAVDKSRLWIDRSIFASGRTNETTRDIVHAQFGLGGIANICEIAHHQGIDLYAHNSNAVQRAFEYHAAILLGETPVDLGPQYNDLKWKKYIAASWEQVVNHYQNRAGLAMVRSAQITQQNRPEPYVFHWGLGTLLHYNTNNM